MRMVDLILDKRNGKILTEEQIDFIVKNYTAGLIPDYQMSAFLMSVYFNGLNKEETAALTMSMAKSGDIVDLSSVAGIKVDKHSTGGVGDKTTLIICPIAAACGVPVAKCSGRGLGHTGGTVDKLESIPGFDTAITEEKFIQLVKKNGICVAGRFGNVTPADKKIYALRDVTGTVDNISLIAASIMSKKIASGANKIVLDVKTGSGAFMKNQKEATQLADAMIEIGKSVGIETSAVLTNMDIPLGSAVGNSLEVIEAIETLKGKGPQDLFEVCIELAAEMLRLGDKGTKQQCKKKAEESIRNGTALKKFETLVKEQGGNIKCINDYSLFPKSKYSLEIKSDLNGYIIQMDTEKIGMAACILGAGREKIEDEIDYGAGIIIKAKTGSYLQTGELLAIFYSNDNNKFIEAEKIYKEAIVFSNKKPKEIKLIL